MDHVAIMAPKIGLIDRILSRQKTIETRWYKNRSRPFRQIYIGDTIYFKDSGKSIRAKATVSKVLFFEDLNVPKCQTLVDQYGSPGLADFTHANASIWADGKKYAILIWLANPVPVPEFEINKTGFGSGCAWITVDNIDTIRKH